MNREQIIKALECCYKDNCDNCPNYFVGNCYANLAGEALSLIKELTEENERLQKANDVLFFLMPSVADAKADTVRKMADRIERRCIEGGIYPAFVQRVIEQVAKEMLGGAESFGIMDKVKERMEEQRTTPKCKHYKRTSDDSTCVSCGMTIPEGRQICHSCEVSEDD